MLYDVYSYFWEFFIPSDNDFDNFPTNQKRSTDGASFDELFANMPNNFVPDNLIDDEEFDQNGHHLNPRY